jgi:hypothetical protein
MHTFDAVAHTSDAIPPAEVDPKPGSGHGGFRQLRPVRQKYPEVDDGHFAADGLVADADVNVLFF